jgi:hypothetical protein
MRLQEDRRRAEEAQKAGREEARRQALNLEQERRAKEAAEAERLRTAEAARVLAAERQKRLGEAEQMRKRSRQIQWLAIPGIGLLIGSAVVTFLF